MSYTVTGEDILSLPCEAAVLSLEVTGRPAGGLANERLLAAGGEALRRTIDESKYLPIGSAARVEAAAPPFETLIATATPRWLTGKANELLALHRCYESVFTLAESLGCRSLALPFLSTQYYRFPRQEAVEIARREAGKHGIETVFVAETPELLALSARPYRKPAIVSYIGYYRDYALFELDNGLYARVDLRSERGDVDVIPYFEACYRAGNNPLQPPLPAAEIARLRALYEQSEC